jgi:hypothetical protein
MVSAPKMSPNANLLYKHDESSSTNNTFYGVQSASTIAITFNDKPSSNKQFKAFSIESGDTVKLNGFNTFTVNKGGSNYTSKNTRIGTLKEKGGIVYGYIGEETRITMSNVEYIGVVKSIVGLFDDSEEISTEEASALGYTVGNNLSFIKMESVESTLSPFNAKTVLLKDTMLEDFSEGGDHGGAFVGSGTFPYSELPVYYNGGIILGTNQVSLANFAIGDRLFFGYTGFGYAGVNGEAPKGQYADAVISLGNDDFEVYALNVEYSPTNLDHTN